MTDFKKDDPSPWVPMNRPIDLKHLGKLGEELGELSAAISRCIIQGIDERDPTTLKTNRERLEEEIADVRGNIILVQQHFNLDHGKIIARQDMKMEYLKKWHGMLK